VRLVRHEHAGRVALRRGRKNAFIKRIDGWKRPTSHEAFLDLVHYRTQLPQFIAAVVGGVVDKVKVTQDVLAAIARHVPPEESGWNGAVLDHGPIRSKAPLLRTQHARH